jgi:hypothetical protein
VRLCRPVQQRYSQLYGVLSLDSTEPQASSLGRVVIVASVVHTGSPPAAGSGAPSNLAPTIRQAPFPLSAPFSMQAGFFGRSGPAYPQPGHGPRGSAGATGTQCK